MCMPHCLIAIQVLALLITLSCSPLVAKFRERGREGTSDEVGAELVQQVLELISCLQRANQPFKKSVTTV